MLLISVLVPAEHVGEKTFHWVFPEREGLVAGCTEVHGAVGHVAIYIITIYSIAIYNIAVYGVTIYNIIGFVVAAVGESVVFVEAVATAQ